MAVWTWAAMVVRALHQSGPLTDDGDWFRTWPDEYTALGTREGDSTLSELFPLPQKSVQDWPDLYQQEFGHIDAQDYFDTVFPLSAASPCREALQRGLLDVTPADAFVICYGGRDAKFWQRDDALADLVPSWLGGHRAQWHIVVPRRIEVGLSRRGHRVARVGFPNGNPVTHRDVPALANGLRAMTP